MHSKRTNEKYCRRQIRNVNNAKRLGVRLDEWGCLVCPSRRARKWVNAVERLHHKINAYAWHHALNINLPNGLRARITAFSTVDTGGDNKG